MHTFSHHLNTVDNHFGRTLDLVFSSIACVVGFLSHLVPEDVFHPAIDIHFDGFHLVAASFDMNVKCDPFS